MTGCGDNSRPQYNADLIAQKEGVSQVTDKSHEPGKLNDATYSNSDNVEYSYQVSMIDGLLTQKVTKEVSAQLNKTTGAWDVTVETLKACEVDATKLPGTSWKCSSVTGEQLESLFGDQVPAGESGTLYIRFLKKMGLFSFNLSNPKNTSTKRFFETVGTNVKLVFVGSSGNVEGKASVTGGSVTNAGDLNLDLETDKGTVNLCLGKTLKRSRNAITTKPQAMSWQVPKSMWTSSLFSSSPQRASVTANGRPNAASRKATSRLLFPGELSTVRPNMQSS